MRDEKGEELIHLRTEGGPFSGNRHVPVSALDGWPPKEILYVEGGSYLKVSESNLPQTVVDHPNICRGVVYDGDINMTPPKLNTTGSLLEKFFGKIEHVEDLSGMDDFVRKTKDIGDTFTEMVNILRSDNLQPERIRQLGALLWCLVGSRNTPLVGGLDLSSMYFWAEPSLACIMCPLNWVQMVKDDPFMQFGAVVYIGSQARDCYNKKLLKISESSLVMERAQAFESEYLHFLEGCSFDTPIFVPNDYQKEIMKLYPNGLASLSPDLWYESKPWEGPIP